MRLLLQRVRVDRVRGVARRPDRYAQRRVEVVAVDPLHEPVDDLGRVVVVGVDQHERELAVLGMAEQIGIAHFVADDARHLLDGAFVGGHHQSVPFAARFEHHEREEVLRAHGPLQLAVEDELEGVRREQP